ISEAIYKQRKQVLERQQGLDPIYGMNNYYTFGQPRGFNPISDANQAENRYLDNPSNQANHFYDFVQPYDNNGQIRPLYEDNSQSFPNALLSPIAKCAQSVGANLLSNEATVGAGLLSDEATVGADF